jgi:hypothetical protein
MEGNESNSLFDIRLNQEGVRAIKKFAKIVKWLMLLIILISLVAITDTLIAYFMFDEKYFSTNKLLLIQRNIYPYYTITYCLLALTQTFNYLKAARNLSVSADANDEIKFNHAFIYLFRSSLFAILTLFIGLVMETFQLYILLVSFYNK